MTTLFDSRNLNTLWAAIIAETLVRCGLKTAIICPGSRSAPLTIAFVQHPQIESIPILDERSASFFALGIAKQTHRPVVLICSSGTAGANFYPAVIEARETRVPLLVLTADPTEFLKQAQVQGATAIDGLEMLVQQGAAALKIWTGNSEVPVTTMRLALQRHLGLI